MAAPILSVRIDWWKSGDFADAIDACTGRVLDCSWSRGRSADYAGEATGTASIVLDNVDDFFTPDRNWHDNPSFEVNTSGWQTSAVAGFTSAASSITKVVDAAPGAGVAAGEVALPAVAGAGVAYWIPYRFRAGQTVSATVFLRSISGSTSIQFGLGADAAPDPFDELGRGLPEGGGYPVDLATGAGTITGAWAVYTVAWTPLADRLGAWFFVRSTGAAAATFRVDGCQVNPGAAANTYIEAPTKGLLVPGRPVHVYATYDGISYPQFYGTIERLTPNYVDRTVALTCYDPFAAMSRRSITLPTRSRTHREIRIDALNAFGAGWRNLLEVNPSFETSTTGWTISSGGQLSRIATDAAPVANAGTSCAEAVAAAGATTITSPTVPVVAVVSMTFRASVWLKLQSGSGAVRLSMQNESGGGLSNGTYAAVTLKTGVWTRLSSTWTANGAHTGVRLQLTIAGSATVRVDAAMITIGPEDRAFVTGAGQAGSLEQNLLTGDPSFEIAPVALNWGNLRSNLVTNPSFEVNVSGWSVAADAFVGASTSITRSTAQSQHGLASGLVAVIGNTSGVNFPITGLFKAGVTYQFSVYIRTVINTMNLKAGIGSQGTPTDVGQVTASNDDSTAWRQHGGSWTPSADRTDVHFFAGINGGVNAPNFYVDQVMVIEAVTLPAFNDPWGFGVGPASFARITGDASSGDASMEVVTTAVNGSGVRYTGFGSQVFFAGVPYTFIAAVRSVAGNAALDIGIGSEGQPADSAVAAITATGRWTAQTVTWTPLADRTDVVVFVRSTGAVAATFRIDGCAVYPGSVSAAYEPSFAEIDVESGRAPSNASAGSVTAILAAVNQATLTRHWISASMNAPYWRYVTESRDKITAKASREIYDDDIADATGFDIDSAAITNVQRIQPGDRYIDAAGVSQANTALGIYDAADAASIDSHGRRDGPAIQSGLLENQPSDVAVQASLGDALVARYASPRARPQIMVVNRWPSQLQRELNDLVILNFRRLQIVRGLYLITRLETKVSESGQRWDTTYGLEEHAYADGGYGGLARAMPE